MKVDARSRMSGRTERRKDEDDKGVLAVLHVIIARYASGMTKKRIAVWWWVAAMTGQRKIIQSRFLKSFFLCMRTL